jgi:hypothetical protein
MGSDPSVGVGFVHSVFSSAIHTNIMIMMITIMLMAVMVIIMTIMAFRLDIGRLFVHEKRYGSTRGEGE